MKSEGLGFPDNFMRVFGMRRARRCPYCDRNGVKRLQCWRAKKNKMVCPKQKGD